jgi:23S rRNA (uracil1939-C5)-methyltransferase
VATISVSTIKTVAMVSCNPVTFGRDVAALVEAGFTLNWVQVVDQFRWSPHVEMIASLTRA